MSGLYSRTVYINTKLNVTVLLTMSGNSGRLVGGTGNTMSSRGILNLTDNALFVWDAGQLADLIVKIDKGTDTTARLRIDREEKTHRMRSVILHVKGIVDWNGGDVGVDAPAPDPAQPESRIEILDGARLNISQGSEASRSLWLNGTSI